MLMKILPDPRAWLCLGLLTLVLLGGGCTSRRPARDAPSVGVPRLVPETPTPAPAPSAEPLPGLIVTDVEGKQEPERFFSFSLRDADIREVLLALSKQSNFNIVPDQDVQGRVTVDLKDVTLSEALDTLTDLLDLQYRVKRNVVRVSKRMVETRIFSLQYVNLKRVGASSTSAQIGTGGSGFTGVTTGGATTVTAGGVSGGAAGQTTVTTSTDTDLWKDIEAGVKELLSEQGKMVVDKQSGNILVTDFPRYLERIAGYLESVEGSVQRQVLIEARVLEVALTGRYEFGLDWGAIAKAGALRGATTIPSVATGRIIGQNLAPDGGDFQVAVTSSDFAAILNVLNEQGEVNVLSSPKLATLNNQTAVIRSATDEVFIERRVVSTPAEGGRVVETEVTPRTVTIGVVLSITPQIGPDGNVVLHIRPTVTESTREATFEVEGDIFRFPVVDVREADMIVRARDSQVVIIGGLIQERKSDDESKVPLLGDLPGIGRLFRSTVQDRRKSELVVLLRPTVLVGKKVEEIAKQDLERLDKMRGNSPW